MAIFKKMACWFLLITFFASSINSDEFAFTPPKNFTLSPKYIGTHHPVKTDQVAAQLYFDQGLTFLYAFNHEAAYWSFTKASELDPNMAMAYWGRALVLGSNINIEIDTKRAQIAYDTIQKAIQLSENGPDNERAYINALKERYSSNPTAQKQELAERYSSAMGDVKNRYPDDPDAAVLYAESILDLSPWNQWENGKPKEATLKAIKALEDVLIQYPMHLGANHYYIHVIEASPEPSRGLLSADRLKTLLPSSGHILHMPSHIYLLVGDFEQAAIMNEKAIAADREYLRQYGMEGIYIVHYLSHNYHFLSQAYSMQGNYQRARQAAEDLQSLYLPHFSRMPELEEYASTLLFVYLRFHKWQELLHLPTPPEEALISRTLLHFGRGVAFASLGEDVEAMKEQQLFLKGQSSIASTTKYGYNSASKIMKLAQYFLEAKLAETQRESSRAIVSYQKAVDEQDSLSYDEPPNWLFSVRDSLGAVLIREKRYAEAESVFRKDLQLHPRSGRSLFGLKISLENQSKMADWYWVDQSFQKAWRFSDTQLNLDNL